jgi:hypothetical protein
MLQSPDIDILNARSLSHAIPAGLERSMDVCPSSMPLLNAPVGALCVFSFQHYIGTVASPLILKDFPFDTQRLQLSVESTSWNSNEVCLLPISGFLDTLVPSGGWSTPEFDVVSTSVAARNETFGTIVSGYSQVAVTITLKRQSGFYLNKIVSITCLIIILGLMLFALAPDAAQRLQGSLTIFLALISMQWVIGQTVPKLAYLTRLDKFMVFNFAFAFILMVTHAVTIPATSNKRRENAI